MSRRTAARVAWSLWTLSVMLAGLATLFYFLSISISLEGRDRPPLEFLPVLLVACLAFSTVGALVAARRPANAISWIFCVLGVFLGAGFSAQFYADYTLIVRPGSLPGGRSRSGSSRGPLPCYPRRRRSSCCSSRMVGCSLPAGVPWSGSP